MKCRMSRCIPDMNILITVIFIWLQLCQATSKRPIYNIAHMVNSIRELQEYLDRGANGVEADIAFNRNGTVRNVYHGYPCDCYRVCDERERIDKYLNYVRDVVNPDNRNHQKNFVLLLLDLKLEDVPRLYKFRAGEELAKNLISHLFFNNDKGNPGINVLVSIGHTSDSDVIKGIQETFTKSRRGTSLSKIGFDVGLNDDLPSIRRMYDKLNIQTNRWQGDGISNCFRPMKDETRLKHAIRIRDSENGFIEKVYDWTVDLTANIRTSLRNGADAILTNFPERVHSVLLENEFKDHYRLATFADNPFSKLSVNREKFRQKPPGMDTYVTSVRETAMALAGYFWDVYKRRFQRPLGMLPIIGRRSHRPSSCKTSTNNNC